jgi:ATP-dependent Zn protease
MALKFFRCFVSITLFLFICPSIFANSAKADNPEFLEKKILQEHEVFQSLMSQTQQQTKTIGFCMQQLCQTVQAGKLKLSSTQKKQVLQELHDIQELINAIIDKLLVQNNPEALCLGIQMNNVMINYLIKTISTDVAKINAETLQALMTTRSMRQQSEEIIFKLFHTNETNIDQLVYTADHAGLTWYNHVYRSLKQNNAYSVAKGVGITALSCAVLGWFLCNSKIDTDNPFFNRWIGQYPQEDKINGGFYVYKSIYDETTKAFIKQRVPVKEFTPFQKVCNVMETYEGTKILATSALITLNYKDLFSWMYKDPYNWAQDKAQDAIKDYDQKLQGTAKPNIGKNGYEKVYFKDMVGCEELEQLAKKIANFIKHPERYERAQIEEHRGILLFGPPQTGKTLFAKALRTLIDDELDSSKSVHFIDAKKYHDNGYSIEEIFAYASFYAPCIVFFDEIDLIGTHRDKSPYNTSQLLTCMQGVDMASKQIIVIGATNRPEQLDKALLVDGRFGKIIHIEYPKYQDRKTYLEQQLTKRSIQLDPAYIDCIAQETDGCSYNILKRIITEAIIFSSLETRQVTQDDFEKTLDIEVRKIQPSKAMSVEERKIIATYQAGKAVARHILKTAQEVVKITINPVIKEVKTAGAAWVIDSTTQKPSDNEKLSANKGEQRIKFGEVFTKTSNNQTDLLSDCEQEKECLALLAGSAALKMICNDSFTSCNKQDRAEAIGIIYNMISQGEKIDDRVKLQALAIKQQFEEKIFELLADHKELIIKIADKLIADATINRYEWQELINPSVTTVQDVAPL